MSVILCRRERVSHPFFIESLGIRVGSSQELCYAFYHHPLLLIDDLMGQDLMDFIREELAWELPQAGWRNGSAAARIRTMP